MVMANLLHTVGRKKFGITMRFFFHRNQSTLRKRLDQPPSAFRLLLPILLVIIATPLCAMAAQEEKIATELSWRPMIPLPDKDGFALPFAGLVNGYPLIAGGANFPNEPLWKGGAKSWSREIFLYDPSEQAWENVGLLPIPLAYGSSFQLNDALILVGGQSDGVATSAVLRIQMESGRIEIDDPFPPLPEPRLMAGGIRFGEYFYLIGGCTTEESGGTDDLLRLPLNETNPSWERLDPIPGGRRFLPTVATYNDQMMVIGGVRTTEDGATTYLKDAYTYNTSKGWTRLPDLIFPSAAAASPAPVLRDGSVILVGGTDGTLAGVDPSTYPKVPRRLQILLPDRSDWQIGKDAPIARVGVSTIRWNEGWIFPTGESSPGVRSPEVWFLKIKP